MREQIIRVRLLIMMIAQSKIDILVPSAFSVARGGCTGGICIGCCGVACRLVARPLVRWAAGPLGRWATYDERTSFCRHMKTVRFHSIELSVCKPFWLVDFFHY